MLERLRRKILTRARPAGEEAHALYAAIASASRDPGFYTRFGIADTLDGRFDTLVLHAVLVLRRLGAAASADAPEIQNLAQGIVDTMFADLDLSLHEIGVSDTKVGRRVKEMARAFLGRRAAYESALDAGDAKALTAAIRRNVYRGGGGGGQAAALAGAVMGIADALAALEDDALDAAHITPALSIPRLAESGKNQ